MKRKILFAASEGNPYIATGGLGDVIGALPQAIKKEDGSDVRVVMPYYSAIKAKFEPELEYLGNMNINLSWRSQYCGIFKGKKNGITFYFIDNEYYFDRRPCYGHFDDGERFAFFSKAVIDLMGFLDFFPDVVHCHDWQTALVPVYLRTLYSGDERYSKLKIVFTIHNIEYQGKFDMAILSDLFGLGGAEHNLVEYDGCINLMKGAIECADIVSTVSPSYACEIFDPFYSHGLTPIIQRNCDKITGILNGIDINFYNPDIDKALFKTYNSNSIAGKYENKKKMQEMLGLSVNVNTPVIAVISRLVSHKGIDIIAAATEEILCRDVQFVVLGKGDEHYENYFRSVEDRYKGKMVAYIDYNPDVARKIYAGADIFLMPSKSEPCGLAQMIASRYGTVPIVRETGGLKDSIHDCTLGEGNGFTFVDYTAHNVMNAVNRALSVYYNKKDWEKLVKAVMEVDFSWDVSAKKYVEMYSRLG